MKARPKSRLLAIRGGGLSVQRDCIVISCIAGQICLMKQPQPGQISLLDYPWHPLTDEVCFSATPLAEPVIPSSIYLYSITLLQESKCFFAKIPLFQNGLTRIPNRGVMSGKLG